jgi:glycosyl transferase family 25
MADAGLRFRFFDAFDGVTAPAQFSAIRSFAFLINSRRRPLPTEIACFASHRALWQRCVELGEPIVVLEDDFDLLTCDFAASLKRLDALTREYGFVRLESCSRPRVRNPIRSWLRPDPPIYKLRENGIDRNHGLYYLADPPTSMVGYAIGPAAATRLIAASESVGAPVDRFMQRTWKHGVPLFGVEPPLIGASAVADVSTIGARTRSRNVALMLLRLLSSVHGKIRRAQFNRRWLRRLGVVSPAKRGTKNAERPVAARSFDGR